MGDKALAIAKPTNLMAAIMPERLATARPGQMLTEMVGSGPFRFLADERVSGARNVYARFEKYLPREGVASFCAGPRVANFERVEWLTTPDRPPRPRHCRPARSTGLSSR